MISTPFKNHEERPAAARREGRAAARPAMDRENGADGSSDAGQGRVGKMVNRTTPSRAPSMGITTVRAKVRP